MRDYAFAASYATVQRPLVTPARVARHCDRTNASALTAANRSFAPYPLQILAGASRSSKLRIPWTDWTQQT